MSLPPPRDFFDEHWTSLPGTIGCYPSGTLMDPSPAALVYEDEFLLAVNKPPGLTVVPGRDEPPAASLRHKLEAARGEPLWVVHRIDRDTSGVVLFARDPETHRALSRAFESRRVQKCYLAFCRGLPPMQGTIRIALHSARKGKMRPALPGEPGALPSETEYQRRGAWQTAIGPVASLEVRPLTGRQHQIRVHLRAIDCPLLVDPLYGRCARLDAGALGAGSPPLTRLTLHAHRLELEHPRTGAPLALEAPLTPDLKALDAWLVTQAPAEGQS